MNPAPARRVPRVRGAGRHREAARWLWPIVRCLLRSTWAAVSARALVQRPVQRHGARPRPPAECGAAYRSHRSCSAPGCRARLRELPLPVRSMRERGAVEHAKRSAPPPSVLERVTRLAVAQWVTQGSALAWLPAARAARAAAAHPMPARHSASRARVRGVAVLARESRTCVAPRSLEPAVRPRTCARPVPRVDSVLPGRVSVRAHLHVSFLGSPQRAPRHDWPATTRPSQRAIPVRPGSACPRGGLSADRVCCPTAACRRSRANESAHLPRNRPKRAPENRLLDYARNCHRQRTNPRSLLRSAARGAQREAASV